MTKGSEKKARSCQSTDVRGEMILNTVRGGSLYLAAAPVLVPFALGRNTSSSSAWAPIEVKWAAVTRTNVCIVSVQGRGSEFLLLIPVVLVCCHKPSLWFQFLKLTMGYNFFPSASHHTPKTESSVGHNVLWRPSPPSPTPRPVSAHSPATSGICASGSSTILRAGKLREGGQYKFFSFCSFLVSEENKREEEKEVVTVLLSGGCLLHH